MFYAVLLGSMAAATAKANLVSSKDHGVCKKLKWQACAQLFLAITMAVLLETAGNENRAGRLGGEVVSLHCLDLAEEQRNDCPLMAIPPGCRVLAVLANGHLAAVISPLHGHSATLCL